MSEVTPERRPKAGIGSAIGDGLAAATGALVSVTGKLFGEVRERAADFRARPEHSRWRAYAIGLYVLILAGTLIGQTYTSNALDAYVRVQPVELPNMTEIFVRNDGRRPWEGVKLTLNGIYTYEQAEVKPGAHILLPINRFAVYDQLGKPTFAPKNIAPKTLTIDAGEQHFETELRE